MLICNIFKSFIRNPLLPLISKSGNRFAALSTTATSYIERNKDRPVSPHILIYKWPITSLTSGSHRVTGTLMSLAIYGLSGAIYAATGHSQEVVDFIQNMAINPTLFTGIKALFIWPLCYHTINGFRHTVWDLGFGFEKSSFMPVAIVITLTSIGMALWVATLKPNCDSKGAIKLNMDSPKIDNPKILID
ncbi:hypothetical protein GJ496_007581 [Pomphorhynchus laevis]|nr:hypothetical protein GJ496_007581 [Pomphorhynchus laevis]